MDNRENSIIKILFKAKKKIFYSFLGMVVVCLALIVTSHIFVEVRSEGKVFKDPDQIPKDHVGLVLGCAQYVAGKRNLFFTYRINAANRLWTSGKVEYLLVSGDNSRKSYDESSAMKMALIKKGVPAEKIFVDYAGFRTLDSVVRASEVFGTKKFVVISQSFHIKRAIFIAEAKNLTAIGFAADDVKSYGSLKTKLREYLARAKMLLDLTILGTEPKFYGPKIQIPD